MEQAVAGDVEHRWYVDITHTGDKINVDAPKYFPHEIFVVAQVDAKVEHISDGENDVSVHFREGKIQQEELVARRPSSSPVDDKE